MWKRIKSYIKSYFKFCGLSLQEKLPSRRVKFIRVVYLIVAFILGWIVNAYFGIKLEDLFRAIYHLRPWYEWIFVGLGVVVLFLLFLIDGARQCHERITSELNDVHGTEISEWRRHADRIYRLSLVYGMALEADDIINFCYGSLTQEQSVRLDSHINSGIQQCLGTPARDSYYDRVPPVPEGVDGQRSWSRSHCANLSFLIEQEQKKQLTIRTPTNLIHKS
jgi:hypothetical protein